MASPSRGPRRGGTPPRIKPPDPALGRALEHLTAGRIAAAAAIIDPMVEKRRKDAGVVRAKGLLEMKSGRYTEAEQYLDRARRLDPKHPMIWVDKATVHQLRGRYEEMVESARAAHRLVPDRPEIQTLVAEALVSAGRYDEAFDFVRDVGAGKPLNPRLADPLTKVLDLQGRHEEAIGILEQVAGASGIDPMVRKRMLLRRGRMLEKMGDHDGAIEAFREGHSQRKLSFDPDVFDRRVDEVLQALRGAEFPEPVTDAGRTRLPVMVVAMPRSGTSLLERIMAAHPAVSGIGEESVISETLRDHRERLGKDPVPDMAGMDPALVEELRADCLGRIRRLSGDGERTVSKHLQNWSFLPVIAAWYPRAQVVRITRDPVATGISIYGQDLPVDRMPWASRLDWIGRVIAAERRFVTAAKELVPNPWLDVVYEDLVSDPKTRIPPIIESLGLDFHPACLEPHKAEATSGKDDGKRFRPTLSLHQVRKPISTGSLDRASVWGDRLGDLRRGLEEGGEA